MIALLEETEQPATVAARTTAREGSRSRTASTLICVGVSHHTAPVELRERLALSDDAKASMLARFGCNAGSNLGPVAELVVVSTCNRLELYASGGEGAEQTLVSLIEEFTGVSEADLRPAVYELSGVDTVRHLCRTAAGLDSMVVGESQILGQVTTAFSAAVAQRAAGHALSTLFRGAIRAGRRARVETGINRNPTSVSAVAVRFVSDAVGDVRDARILVLGAGEAADLAASAFHQRGARNVVIVSRTAEHAKTLADKVGGSARSWDRLNEELSNAEVLIVATGAPLHIVTREMVRTAMAGRRDRKLAIIDISMPRNVDPAVRELGGVSYWDLDDLQLRVATARAEREHEAPEAERVVDDEAKHCIAELHQLDVQPLISDLRAHMDSVRRAVLEKAMRTLPELTDNERARVEAFSESLVNRLFHEPMVRLRDEAEHGQAAGYAMAMRHLFGLET